MKSSTYISPFLKRLTFSPPTPFSADYPYSIPIFSSAFEVEFSSTMTFFVGENGTGKSTLLEAIATKAGFNLSGGNRNHRFSDYHQTTSIVSENLRLSWFPKVADGFFMRAETFYNFASYIQDLASDDPEILDAYGGKSLHAQSHGESFLALFKSQFNRKGIYLLDEPEAALSPSKQLSFMALMHELEMLGHSQFIIATHSPILICYPGAKILNFDTCPISTVDYSNTEHYKLTKTFLESPMSYFRHLFS